MYCYANYLIYEKFPMPDWQGRVHHCNEKRWRMMSQGLRDEYVETVFVLTDRNSPT